MTDWTDQQKQCFEAMAGDDNLLIRALAGSGKTTTLAEMARQYKRSNSRKALVCLVFTTKNRDQMAAKLDGCGTAKTFNQWGSSLIYQNWGRVKYAKQGALRQYIRDRFPNIRGLTSEVYQAIEWIMNTGVHPEDYARIRAIAANLVRGRPDVAADADRKVAEATETMIKFMVTKEWATREIGTEFLHGCYLPYLYKWEPAHKVAVGLGDEVQDASAPQAYMLRTMGHRTIFVGDENQAIYGWRGASGNAMNLLRNQTCAKVLELTKSFRCARLIAAEVKPYVPAFEAARDELGIVNNKSADEVLNEIKPGDVILSRVNAALVPFWVKLTRKGIPTRILGRNLLNTVRKLLQATKEKQFVDAYTVAATSLLEAIEQGRSEGLEMRQEEQDLETLDAINAAFKDDNHTVKSLLDILEAASPSVKSGSDFDGVELSTVHQAKGLEWDRAYVLRYTFRHEQHDDEALEDDEEFMNTASREEINLWYVAITRAINVLTYVYQKDEEQEEDDE